MFQYRIIELHCYINKYTDSNKPTTYSAILLYFKFYSLLLSANIWGQIGTKNNITVLLVTATALIPALITHCSAWLSTTTFQRVENQPAPAMDEPDTSCSDMETRSQPAPAMDEPDTSCSDMETRSQPAPDTVETNPVSNPILKQFSNSHLIINSKMAVDLAEFNDCVQVF